nr:reverse transcriptase domain-containing protein [Tanacetum cinerariifolium]
MLTMNVFLPIVIHLVLCVTTGSYNQPLTSGTLPSNTIPNPKGEMKAVTTRSGLAYEGPSIPTESPLEKVDEQNTEEIFDKEYSNSSRSTTQVQPPVVTILILEPDVLRTQTKPTIPYPSRLNDQKLQEKATNQMEKFFQIFHDFHFDISFTDALLLMPKFSSTIKSLLANKDKLFKLAKVLLNENCSAMLLKKLPKKLRDPGKFLIPCDFPGMEPLTLGTLPSNTIPNSKGEMKAVTTRSGLAYEGPSIPTESPLEKVDEQNTEEILDKEHSNSSRSTAQIQPPVVPISILEPDVPRTQPKPSIPYPSSFANALLLMPKFVSTIKSLLANKDKLFELAKVSLNENCSAMLLKKLPEKLGDPGKFLIPCDFPGMEICHALADLGASINLIPLSIWKKCNQPTPTRMTLELADRSITRPKGVAEDVFVKVGKFYFPTDFIVVDFEADPRVPLILGRSFLRTDRALIDVYGEEITLRENDESITFYLNQTMRYSLTYDDTSVNRVDVIDVTCEDFVQDVLDFQYNPKSSNPTLVSGDSVSRNDSCK